MENNYSCYTCKNSSCKVGELDKPIFNCISYMDDAEKRKFFVQLSHKNDYEITEKSCMTCQNMSCRVEYSDKFGVDENGNSMGYNCVGYMNDNYKLTLRKENNYGKNTY